MPTVLNRDDFLLFTASISISKAQKVGILQNHDRLDLLNLTQYSVKKKTKLPRMYPALVASIYLISEISEDLDCTKNWRTLGVHYYIN